MVEPISDPDPAAGEPDFADEHDATWVRDDETGAAGDSDEPESPAGHSGLEPTDRAN